MRTRAQMRGRRLDPMCKRAKVSRHEFGESDDRCFCYGLVDKTTDEYLPECRKCGAFVFNAEYPRGN